MPIPEVKQLRRCGLWVIHPCPWRDIKWCGPYATQREARAELKGIKRAIRNTNK